MIEFAAEPVYVFDQHFNDRGRTQAFGTLCEGSPSQKRRLGASSMRNRAISRGRNCRSSKFSAPKAERSKRRNAYHWGSLIYVTPDQSFYAFRSLRKNALVRVVLGYAQT
jgi:hypothetical protein